MVQKGSEDYCWGDSSTLWLFIILCWSWWAELPWEMWSSYPLLNFFSSTLILNLKYHNVYDLQLVTRWDSSWYDLLVKKIYGVGIAHKRVLNLTREAAWCSQLPELWNQFHFIVIFTSGGPIRNLWDSKCAATNVGMTCGHILSEYIFKVWIESH